MGNGVKQREDGTLEISPELQAKLREHRMRSAAQGVAPTTPRFTPMGPYGAVERTSGIQRYTATALRDIRNSSVLLKAIHRVRHAQFRAVCRPSSGQPGSVGYRLVHVSAPEPQQKAPEGFDKIIATIKPLVERPQPRWCPTLAQAMVMGWEDLAVINQPASEPLHHPQDERHLLAWRFIDGAMVQPLADWLQSWRTSVPQWSGALPGVATTADELAYLSRKTNLDLQGKDPAAWLLVREGIPERIMGAHDLHVGPMMTSTDIRQVGYWPSYVEDAITLIRAWDQVFAYNHNYFKQGWMAEFILGIKGGGAAEVQTLVAQLRDNVMGVSNAWIPPVIPISSDGDLISIPMKQANREMTFETLDSRLVSLICALYRMRPEELNARDWAGGNSPSLSEGSKNEQIEAARSDGLRNDIGHLTEACIEPVLRRIHPDVRLVWDFGEEKAKDVIEITSQAVSKWRTRNEARNSEGADPIGFWVPAKDVAGLSDEDYQKFITNPWNSPADPSFMQQINAQAQREQQEKMMAQYGPAAMQQQQGGGSDQGGFGGGQDGDQDGGQDDPWGGFGVPVQPAGVPAPDGGQGGGGNPMRKAVQPRVPRILIRITRNGS